MRAPRFAVAHRAYQRTLAPGPQTRIVTHQHDLGCVALSLGASFHFAPPALRINIASVVLK